MSIPFPVRLGALAALSIAAACTPAATPVVTTPTPVAMQSSATLAPSAASAVAVDVSTPPTYRKAFGTMWTFDAPPLDYWKQTYGFAPPAGWLDNVRLSAVRLPGCSASFVSSDGLVMTNHHCARECTAGVSPKDTNYIESGFAAKALGEEKKCEGMTADQLQSITDVTPQIQASMTGATDSVKTAQRTVAIAELEKSCGAESGLTCQVVTLYNGGRYSLYRFKRFTDVRLVMAPEEAAAFFGGDPDNFTFPRYDLDLTLLRVYENGAPLKAANHLRWSANGATENELVFVIGNPGSTERLGTMAQLEFNRDVGYPLRLRDLRRGIEFIQWQIARNPAVQRAFQNDLFGNQNAFKAISGFERGLLDSTLMANKRAFEAEVRARVAANPAWQAEYGGAWDAIAAATKEQAATLPRMLMYAGGRGTIFSLARVTIAAARGTPNAAMGNPLPIDTADATTLKHGIALQLQDIATVLPATDPFVQWAFNGQTAEAAAARLVDGSKIRSVEFRRALIAGGAAAVDTSTDPVVMMARGLDSLDAPLRARYFHADAIIKTNSANIGRALYAVYGTILPPDATFTLRISDGIVKGYPMNGTIAPYRTSLYGLFGRSAEFDNKWPFKLSAPWVAARNKLDLSTPADFVSTNDIIGGNSGSPVINRNGEVVGLIFDGNIESLPNRFVFTDDVARSVSVHSAMIIEALRKVYDANRIADELQGKATATGVKK